MSEIEFVLTASLQKQLRGKGFTLVCPVCNKPIAVGNKVLSRRLKKTKHYHPTCFLKLFFSPTAPIVRSEH